MHVVEAVNITNFRSIMAGEFKLSAYTPFVGYNNAGKSNVLRALSWLLKKYSLAATDFNGSAISVVVEGTIAGITAAILQNLDEKHRARIEPFIADGKLIIRRTQAQPGAASKDITLEVKKVDGSGQWASNPAGIDQAITELFPEPILIGAMQDAAEDVAKFGRNTTIGQLLSEIMEPIRQQHSAAIEAALANVRATLSANGENKDERLVAIDSLMEAEIGKFFPGISAKTHIPIPQFDDFLKGGTIKVFEPGVHQVDDGRSISSMGHGSQRAIQMALINCLSKVKSEANLSAPRTTLLLIDEPELYLHPQAIERVRIALKGLTNVGYQVLFSTHSANMVSREDAENVVFIRRTAAEGTYCRPTLMDAVKSEIANAEHQSELIFSLTHSSKILFADRIILSEGKTEHRILPELIAAMTGKTLEEMKTAVIEVAGSPNIPAALRILTAMGLPVKAIVDLDFAFKVATQHNFLDATSPEVAACRQVFVTLEQNGDLLLSQDGYPQRHNGQTAAQGFELLAAQADAQVSIAAIHEAMKAKGIWVWKRGAIEPHLGLNAKTSAIWAKFVKDLSADQTCSFAADPDSITALCAWLCDGT
ncbi:ATP-dependent nuclease [Neorhizobium galegae]|uniref:ATP-dependent endonuclease of the OLD family-like protein n=1 Tax=Neorhizobium galegae bv. officinalis TaxID=323656 RepID=A0A0T7GI67_NEOGA|nr:AAA family ATPase [Neorhizobium galegae]CDZ46982.1 ATP-dependent endonuclease of the OLD family-like protein [Neorhizobium galegae bv. officinalis]